MDSDRLCISFFLSHIGSFSLEVSLVIQTSTKDNSHHSSIHKHTRAHMQIRNRLTVAKDKECNKRKLLPWWTFGSRLPAAKKTTRAVFIELCFGRLMQEKGNCLAIVILIGGYRSLPHLLQQTLKGLTPHSKL